MLVSEGYYEPIGNLWVRLKESWLRRVRRAIRHWLLLKLAGKSSVVINVRQRDGIVVLRGVATILQCQDLIISHEVNQERWL